MTHAGSTLTLEQLDADDAIAEAAARVDSHTRAAFLRKAGVFGGSIVASGAALGALPGLASAAGGNRDVDILNFALTLEYLEAAFYHEALSHAGLRGDRHLLAEVVGRHEREHVAFLRKALESKAVARPRFDFGAATRSEPKFLATAFALENEGVAAYSGQGPRIKSTAYVEAALSILTVEARHASAWAMIQSRIDGPRGISPHGAFDKPKTMARVLSDVKALKFIK